MFTIENKSFENKLEMYDYMNNMLKHLISDETDAIANLSNAASLFGHIIPDINWVGFYLQKNNELILGPFWGKPACTRITIGEGVCGTAAQSLETQLVEDVDLFPGHIACDSASKSEIVLPITVEDELKAVLDIDSPRLARFNQDDKKGLQKTVKILKSINWNQLK
jgi:GAF domain-containing protein